MGPGVPREARLVCVCTNDFAQTLPSALPIPTRLPCASAEIKQVAPGPSVSGPTALKRRSAADRGEYRKAAGAIAQVGLNGQRAA